MSVYRILSRFISPQNRSYRPKMAHNDNYDNYSNYIIYNDMIDNYDNYDPIDNDYDLAMRPTRMLVSANSGTTRTITDGWSSWGGPPSRSAA